MSEYLLLTTYQFACVTLLILVIIYLAFLVGKISKMRVAVDTIVKKYSRLYRDIYIAQTDITDIRKLVTRHYKNELKNHTNEGDSHMTTLRDDVAALKKKLEALDKKVSDGLGDKLDEGTWRRYRDNLEKISMKVLGYFEPYEKDERKAKAKLAREKKAKAKKAVKKVVKKVVKSNG